MKLLRLLAADWKQTRFITRWPRAPIRLSLRLHRLRVHGHAMTTTWSFQRPSGQATRSGVCRTPPDQSLTRLESQHAACLSICWPLGRSSVCSSVRQSARSLACSPTCDQGNKQIHHTRPSSCCSFKIYYYFPPPHMLASSAARTDTAAAATVADEPLRNRPVSWTRVSWHVFAPLARWALPPAGYSQWRCPSSRAPTNCDATRLRRASLPYVHLLGPLSLICRERRPPPLAQLKFTRCTN